MLWFVGSIWTCLSHPTKAEYGGLWRAAISMWSWREKAFERESRSNLGLRGETASWATFRRIFRSIHLMGLPPGGRGLLVSFAASRIGVTQCSPPPWQDGHQQTRRPGNGISGHEIYQGQIKGEGAGGAHPPLLRDTCGFLIQLVFCKKQNKTKQNYVVYWCWSRARYECTPS